MLDRYSEYILPSAKHLNKKSEGIGLLKDLFMTGKLLVSDRCVNLIRELKTYRLNDTGQFVKKDDHSIDALRYAVGASHYTIKESSAPIAPADLTPGQRDDPPRAYTPARDMRETSLDLWGGESYLFEEPDDW